MRQQGFSDEPDADCNLHFSALYFQPYLIGALLLVAILAGSPRLFLFLSAVLWWNALFPQWNPFELYYNRFIALPQGKPRLTAAPAPRRFAQGIAATFMLLAGASLLAGWTAAAWVFQGFIVIAFAALLFGKFCLGAYVYHLLRGQFAFAHSTLPWSRP
jgi:hypothetical protein